MFFQGFEKFRIYFKNADKNNNTVSKYLSFMQILWMHNKLF